MAQVTVRINGYAYTVGCQDGEEEHLQAMADEVERRIDRSRWRRARAARRACW